MISTDKQAIEYVVTRGVERVFPNEDFLRSRLSSGERLRIYYGIDPTGPTLHMGHMVGLMKMAQLQNLGHEIILLIGDFTARIGDPDKSSLRKQLTHDEVLENAKLYQEQASALISFDGDNPARVVYNGTWLDEMNFADVLQLSSQMTVQRMMDRDMFRRRYDAGNPIYIHEFMYPLMQGYDSVALDVDGEVGGNDQTFNMLVGRDLMKNLDNPKEKFVIPMKLLVDNQGEKMGKTTGNMLSFLDSANEKFKKIMSWTDGMILNGFELLTNHDLSEIKRRLDSDENPRDIKFDLASEVVTMYHDADIAQTAKDAWINDVQKDNTPDSIPEISLGEDIVETLSQATSESKSQIRRSLREGAVKVNGEKVNEEYILVMGDTIQIGKKRWYKIV